MNERAKSNGPFGANCRLLRRARSIDAAMVAVTEEADVSHPARVSKKEALLTGRIRCRHSSERSQRSQRPGLHRLPPLLDFMSDVRHKKKRETYLLKRGLLASVHEVLILGYALPNLGAADDPRDADEEGLGIGVRTEAMKRSWTPALVDDVSERERRSHRHLQSDRQPHSQRTRKRKDSPSLPST